MLILQLAVVCVLCIAGVNVAHLLPSPSLARSREIALQIALGASWIRVMRQALLEGALLAVSGGALGVYLALMGYRRPARKYRKGSPQVTPSIQGTAAEPTESVGWSG